MEQTKYSIDGRVIPTINGGAGSGNFGHLGRPGKVGGSAKSGTAHAETVIIGGSSSFTEAANRYAEYLKKQKLITKMRRMRSMDKFDKAHEAEMLAAGFTEEDIKKWKIKIATKITIDEDKKKHAKELRERAKTSPEQKEAVNGVLEKITVLPKDATWLRNNCSPEMAVAFNEEMAKAAELGIDTKKIHLVLNDAKVTNGSLGYRKLTDAYELKISKQILRDYESSKATRERSGPNGSKWWSSDKVSGTFAHEIGHAMEWEAIKRLSGGKEALKTQSSWLQKNIANAITHSAIKNLESRGINVRENHDREYKFMSQYGHSNAHEMIAESFSNPNYSEFTKEIYKITKNGLTGKVKDDMERAIARVTRGEI